ncbi:MAG: VCBS repeat-containing protein [Lacunisphaera sp.]
MILFGMLAASTSLLVQAEDARSIRQAGFAAFVRGTPENGGTNLYVSHHGRVEVINRWDINRDGFNDVVISNDHNEYEVVDALVYWNSDRGLTSLVPDLWRQMPLAQVLFDQADQKAGVTRLPAFGGGRSVIADLNRDGIADLVFCNYIHNYPGLRSAWIYWGDRDGYSAARRSELPTQWAAGVAAGDLNGDGYPDLVFANFGHERGLESISRDSGRDSYIYWGSATGFDHDHPGRLPTRGSVDVAIADLNQDGHPDIAFVNSSPDAQELQVFWGGDDGHAIARSSSLPLPSPTSIRAGDVNGDGIPDLVITTAVTRYNPAVLPAAKQPDAQQSVCLVLGSKQGFSAETVVRLPSSEGRDSAIGDFNHDGFADLAVANFSDGMTTAVSSLVYWGSAGGFSPLHRTELPTLGATGVVATDLNRDGFADLVFSNSIDDETCDVPSYVYWGSATGFAPYLRQSIQSFGAASVNAGDLNRDGRDDLLLINQSSGGGHARTNSAIFWGNPHHYYSTASMLSLPGHEAYDTTVADLNGDGFNDLVVANAIGDSYLYWGNGEGFSPARRSDLPSGSALVSTAVDLNRDGYLDLVFSGLSGTGTILWGSADGFTAARRDVFHLQTTRSTGHRVADLNRDGYLDLVFQDDYAGIMQILWGGPDGYSEKRTWSKFVSGGSLTLADLNGDGMLDFIITGGFDPAQKSYNTKTRIFPGTPDGTPAGTPVAELEAFGAAECAVSDLNRDGEMDLVLSNYMSDTTRSLPLFVYWGGRGGHFDDAHRLELPAESSCGIQTIDLNQDSYPEIIVQNHLKDGRHSISSYIYWNGPQGFDRERRTELPTFGTHYSPWADPGNIYTRKLEEAYVSSAIQLPAGQGGCVLRWKADEPHGAKLKFQVRTAATPEALEKANWAGPAGASSFYATSGSPVSLGETGRQWMQYRAIFTSPDAGDWASLEEVVIEPQH